MVTLYRSGYIPQIRDLQNPSALRFDKLAEPIRDAKFALRSDSVFSCLTLKEAYEWEDWRIDKGLDADFWGITVPDDVQLFAHRVDLWESSNRASYNEPRSFHYACEYYETSILVTDGMSFPGEGKWEVLIPVDIIIGHSRWEMVEENNWYGMPKAAKVAREAYVS